MAVSLPIVEVTVLEDRAHVVRQGVIALERGLNRVRQSDVAPVLSDKSLSAALRGTSAARVIDVRVERERLELDADRPDEVRSIEEAVLRVERERAELVSARDLGRERAAALDRVARLTLAEVSEDAASGRLDRERAGQALARIEQEENAQLDAMLVLERRLEESARELEDLRRRRANAHTPAARCRATLVVEVLADEACETTIDVEYVVPGACWRPYHRAELCEGAETTLTMRTDACVWQRTGERWENVRLVLSTERASLGVEPPELQTDALRTRRRSAVVHVATRDQAIERAGLEGDGTAPALPGIDDGGEARIFRPARAVTVPDDGRPHRLELFSFTSTAEAELVAMPELAEAVLLKSTQHNRASFPLLAGPVDLIRSSGLVGRTRILYIASGERFELGWGPELSLRLTREAEASPEKEATLSSWTSVTHRVRCRVSNLGPTARSVRISERIPVSEIEKVKVEHEPKHTTGKVAPDTDGLIEFRLDVAAYARGKFELGYIVRRHADVVGLE